MTSVKLPQFNEHPHPSSIVLLLRKLNLSISGWKLGW